MDFPGGYMNIDPELLKTARHWGISYEILSDRRGFDVVLHAETRNCWPFPNSARGDCYSALMDVADLLVGEIPRGVLHQLELTSSHYTLHPPGLGEIRPKLTRSITLMFTDVEDNSPILRALESALDQLGCRKAVSYNVEAG
jgi:hypothetical protein